jgi:hypothetical protein
MSIEAASRFVAQTELALEAAREVEAHANAAANAIAERISETESRCRKIRADHAAGRLTDAQAGGLFHLAEQDRADLLGLHRDALVQAGEAVRQTQAAQDEHRRAIDDLSKAEAAARFAAMRAYAEEFDSRLCQAVAELAALARQAGSTANGLTALFRPSNALSSMCRFGQVPPAAQS